MGLAASCHGSWNRSFIVTTGGKTREVGAGVNRVGTSRAAALGGVDDQGPAIARLAGLSPDSPLADQRQVR